MLLSRFTSGVTFKFVAGSFKNDVIFLIISLSCALAAFSKAMARSFIALIKIFKYAAKCFAGRLSREAVLLNHSSSSVAPSFLSEARAAKFLSIGSLATGACSFKSLVSLSSWSRSSSL